jgi:two-component system, chemotaxis family, protein-glutamate methylesterase/glutaminase
VMPGIGGIATLKAIREIKRDHIGHPPIEVLLVSSLTSQGARATAEGLQLGAIDYVLKPDAGSEEENMAALRKLLIEKLDIYHQKCHGRRPFKANQTIDQTASSNRSSLSSNATKNLPPESSGGYKAIAIGISTGGPETLAQFLPDLVGRTKAPIFIVQHILSGLSKYMAESLGRRIGHEILEAQDGLVVKPGGVYLAQGGLHMVLRRNGETIEIGLSDAPPENHSRPAVDVFLRSAAAVYGPSLVAAIMTGMLNDGANGIRAVKRAGGFVIAQDQATSVIWGMPRAAIETGVVDMVLPLNQVAEKFLHLVAGS